MINTNLCPILWKILSIKKSLVIYLWQILTSYRNAYFIKHYNRIWCYEPNPNKALWNLNTDACICHVLCLKSFYSYCMMEKFGVGKFGKQKVIHQFLPANNFLRISFSYTWSSVFTFQLVQISRQKFSTYGSRIMDSIYTSGLLAISMVGYHT